LAGEVEALAGDLARGAARISKGRTRAAPALAAALGDELVHLGMPGASVVVALEPLDDPGPDGAERVELRFAAGAGHTVRPLSATASGGELSRTMLACRSVLADLDDVPTIVFDEVDAGIGGEAGLAVGRRLAAVATTRQVVVVTHLPQIACFADRHVRVQKRGTSAGITILDDDQRIRELSRMLAGLTESEGAVTHAEELLAAAAADRAPSG
jgi:DNA repair protein RecN (Recombination protein N)